MLKPKPDPKSLWNSVLGEDLVSHLDVTDNLNAILHNKPTIYLWKVRMVPTQAQRASGISYAAWLDNLCQTPTGRLINKKLGFLYVNDLEIRGDGLTEDKQRFFEDLLSSPKGREWMTRFLRGLNQHLPALYVGETQQLAVRIRQHIMGDSDFGGKVLENLNLSWQQLELFYASVDNPNSNETIARLARQSFEYLTSCVTLAGFTSRRG